MMGGYIDKKIAQQREWLEFSPDICGKARYEL